MIIAGAVVFYVIVILFGVDENVASHSTVNGLCHARIWLVAVGFSLLYGTIFAKTWRIYYIFNHSKPNSKFVSELTHAVVMVKLYGSYVVTCVNIVILQEIKDTYLFGLVGILVLTDIVFLIPPTVISSARLRRDLKEVEGDDVSNFAAIAMYILYT